MILADVLPQPNLIQASNTMVRTVIIDELVRLPTATSSSSSESILINDNSNSITPIKIPLVSFEPILATSPNYILVNEYTKRKNQFIIFDNQLQKFTIRCRINEIIIDALWYDNQQEFLLLTETNIFALNPNTKKIKLIEEFIPIKNKNFKSFTLINQSILLIAYNEWGAEYIDKWELNNDNGLWKHIEKQSLKLTSNEFIGNILAIIENNCINLVMTIYNDLTEQWRLEICNGETLICEKKNVTPWI